MKNTTKELFLTEYFKQLAALGPFCSKSSFDFLAEVFQLSSKEAAKLWSAAEQESVVDIVTLEDANRYKRILQLLAINDTTLPASEVNNTIFVKSNAITAMSEIGMCAERNVTSAQTLQNLHAHVLQGYTTAMYIWGTIQCEGNDALCVAKHFETGVADIEKAAHWGYIPAILTLLHYLNNKDRYPTHQINHTTKYYQKLLCAFALNSPYRDMLDVLNIKRDACDANAQLLLALIAQRKIKTELFDKSVANVVYGDTIDNIAKEKLLFDPDANAIKEIATLPTHLLRGIREANEAFFQSLPFVNRDAEKADLLNEINRMGDVFFEQRKPVCLCCQDPFALDAYKRGFENMESDGPKPQHVATIDIAELSDVDLLPNADNVFVTTCKNNSRNLYLLVLQGNISADKIRAVKNFLQYNKRAKFKLCQPAVTLDLSPIAVVCLCDKQNADKLSGAVNVGTISPLSAEERLLILKRRIQEVHRRYEDLPLHVNDSDIELLSRYPLDTALMALEKLYQRISGGAASAKDIAFYIAEAEKSHNGNRGYGFGG